MDNSLVVTRGEGVEMVMEGDLRWMVNTQHNTQMMHMELSTWNLFNLIKQLVARCTNSYTGVVQPMGTIVGGPARARGCRQFASHPRP